MKNIINFFARSAGALLAVAAIAKLVSSTGTVRILQNTDPILAISFRHIFWIAGGIELSVAIVCFFSKRIEIKTGLIAWLATSFLVYRIGLVLVGYHKPCSCLGNLTDVLHIPPKTADTAMKIILAYLLIGSYGILFHLWWKRKAEGKMQNDEVKPEARVE